MVLLVLTMTAVVLFFFLNGGEPVERSVYLSIAVMTIYLLVYLFLPPHLSPKNPYSGKLFELVPLVCFGLLLFPELAGSAQRSTVKPLSWLGLILVSTILLCFKLFVW